MLGVGVCAGVVCVPWVSLEVRCPFFLLSVACSSFFSCSLLSSLSTSLLLLEGRVGIGVGRGEALDLLLSGETSPFCCEVLRGVLLFAFPSFSLFCAAAAISSDFFETRAVFPGGWPEVVPASTGNVLGEEVGAPKRDSTAIRPGVSGVGGQTPQYCLATSPFMKG